MGAGVSPHRRGPALGVPDGAGGGRRGSGKALAPLPHRRPTGSITPAPPPLAPAPSPHTGRGAPEPHLAPARQSVARPAPLRSPRAGGEAEGRAEDSLTPGLSAAGDAPRASRGSPPPARPPGRPLRDPARGRLEAPASRPRPREASPPTPSHPPALTRCSWYRAEPRRGGKEEPRRPTAGAQRPEPAPFKRRRAACWAEPRHAPSAAARARGALWRPRRLPRAPPRPAPPASCGRAAR